MAEVPSTHYVKSDDVYIAYQVLGEGPLDLMFVPGFVSNVEAIWQSPNRSRFLRRLASFCHVIIFDKRGTGMSDRGSQIFTLEQRMHDVQTILNEVGSDRAALFGISEGGPMSLLYAATYPERTSALVLYGTYAERSWSPDLRSTTRTLTRCDGAAPTSRCPSTAKAVRWTAFSIRPDVAF
jgi:pimeloyl-ACP methyl ester carboxylesterase